ncbi:MAG: hypothetical protein JW944_11325, partial [Deltaproteobacteria bacterium]|nr:hypothetical protein [Deltaproteobacteria bacterium]
GAFSNRAKFTGSGLYNYDLRWDQFITGYLLDINYSGRTFFPSSVLQEPLLTKMYNTKWANDIYMFRKIDVKRPDAEGTIVTFEPQATTDYYVDDDAYNCATSSDPGTCPGDGLSTTKFTVATMSFGDYADIKTISMDQFITDYVTDSPGSYTYKIIALDGTYEEGWTYEDMQDAYYLLDFDMIVLLDDSMEEIEGSKINFPVRIELVGTAVVYDYSTADPPAFVPSPYEIETE